MQFDLRQLARIGGEDHLDRTFQPAQFDTPGARDDDYTIVSPVHLVVDVRKDRDAYRVTGQMQTRLRFDCGRCLEPFDIPVESAFELRYVPEPAVSQGGQGPSQGHSHGRDADEREVPEDDLTTAFYRNETLDLGELMHEQFVLALPMKPLCSDTCKGLCPVCGTNLNTESCECTPSWTDPRLAELQGLLDRNQQASAGKPDGLPARSEARVVKGPRQAKTTKES